MWAKISHITTIAAVLSCHALEAVSAIPLENLKRQTIQSEYDFIILGGGTAGLVLANRLSESGTAIDWTFYTAPQPNLGGRILPYHRGRGLGGSSLTNGLYYGRGSASVYDHWVSLGNPGWGWNDIYSLFIKGTHFNSPNANTGFDRSYETWDPAAYSNGPLEIGFQGYVSDSNVGFIKACEAANVPIVNELNNGNNLGVKQGTGCLDSRYRRSSSYDSYYKQAANRTNLDILHYAAVQSIQFSKNSSCPTATGAVFIDEPTGLIHEVTANKEVILSMGAFHSPQLLMISGVGPSKQLEEFGITPMLINENVGQNTNDHSVFSIMALSQTEASTSSINNIFMNLQSAQQKFYANDSGPYTAPSGITNGFQRLSNETIQAIGAQAVIDAGLTNRSHVEFLYESIFYPGGPTPYYTPLSNESYISLTASSLVALSRGNLTLRSGSMADAPVINPDYYADPADRAIAINAFKDLRKIFAHPDLAQYTVGPNNGEISPGSAVSNDDEDAIFEYIKSNTVRTGMRAVPMS